MESSHRDVMSGRLAWLCGLIVLLGMAAGCSRDVEKETPHPVFVVASDGPRLGGEGTVISSSRSAFGLPARNLEVADRDRFQAGDAVFSERWSPPGVGPADRQGLGPTFLSDSCSGCHVRDGRARPPDGPSDPVQGLLVMLGVSADAVRDGYGSRLQDRAVAGIPVEGVVRLVYEEQEETLGSGETVSLRRPVVALSDLAFGPIGDSFALSVRVAPPVFGSGLLEAVPVEVLEGLADPEDSDGDGVSGRIHRITDSGRGVVGRFGWKATQSSVRDQAADAFLEDLGVTSPLLPEENCPPRQVECRSAASGIVELTLDQLDDLAFYVSSLGVPAMRNVDDPVVEEGARLFTEIGCSTCHVPTLVTGDHALDHLADQVIHPFTDLLLHDMGEGLADGVSQGDASGSEWRTPPLWGIGLTETVNGHTSFLHDGRARSLTEAILWHGGEAEFARERFRLLSEEQMGSLIRFLESL